MTGFYMKRNTGLKWVNPLVPNAPFLYPLKTSENLSVFWCFQGVKKGCIGKEWVKETQARRNEWHQSLCMYTFRLGETKVIAWIFESLETSCTGKHNQITLNFHMQLHIDDI